MAVKTWTTERVTSADINTYLTNSGLVFVKQQTIGTGVTSVTMTDCFSSQYDSYRVVVANGNGSTAANLQFQFQGRTANYYGSIYYDLHTGGDTGTARRSNGANLLICITSSLGYYNSDFNVSGVNNGRPNISGTHYGNGYAGWFGGVCDTGSTITVTGITLSPSTGTLTGGTITVYGYRKA
jgi:hypothetical protein